MSDMETELAESLPPSYAASPNHRLVAATEHTEPSYAQAPPDFSGDEEIVEAPTYARYDPATQCYTLRPPYIYATVGDTHTACFQLEEDRSPKTNRPVKLRMRPMSPNEARQISLSQGNNLDLQLSFDDDRALYRVHDMMIHHIELDIIGSGTARALPGLIRMASKGLGLISSKHVYFWHLTEQSLKRRDSLRHSTRGEILPWEGWDKTLLFTVSERSRLGIRIRRGRGSDRIWSDASGRNLAVENENGNSLSMVSDQVEKMTGQNRDALIMCWVTKNWNEGTVKFG